MKGQVTVPKQLRDAFGWRPGDRVEFQRESDGVKLVQATRRGRGARVVNLLKRARWNRRLTADRLMALTRGEDR